MNYIFKNAELPCNDKEDFNTTNITTDIVCRIYLCDAPSQKHEKIAKELDGKNYDSDCFFIETIAGKNEENGDILTSGWLLYYVLDNGDWYEYGFIDEVDGAWDFFKKEIGVEF